MARLLLILLALTQLAAAAPQDRFGERDEAAQPVSLVALLARPSDFNGRKVRVEGILSLEFEGQALFLDDSAYRNGLRTNAVWLDTTGTSLDRVFRRHMQGRAAVVEGRFDPAMRGHMGDYSGGLGQITFIGRQMTRAEFFQRSGQSGDAYWSWQVRDPRLWLLLLITFAIPVLTGWFLLRTGRRLRPRV